MKDIITKKERRDKQQIASHTKKFNRSNIIQVGGGIAVCLTLFFASFFLLTKEPHPILTGVLFVVYALSMVFGGVFLARFLYKMGPDDKSHELDSFVAEQELKAKREAKSGSLSVTATGDKGQLGSADSGHVSIAEQQHGEGTK